VSALRYEHKSPIVVRVYLPPDVNSLVSVADHCLCSINYVNVMVADEQVYLQYLDMEAAIAHCTKGVGIGDSALTDLEFEAIFTVAFFKALTRIGDAKHKRK
jgi:xylulose-5-phosphate/fructose-6-phosphate phosphoketolase